MTGNPVSDGYGGTIGDGYGGTIGDGYAPVAVPYDGRKKALINFAAHFARTPSAGRAPRRVAFIPPPPPPSPAVPFDGRRRALAHYAAHFSRPRYPGRRGPHFNYGGGTNLPPRASQVITETLVQRAAGARASQTVTETLVQRKSGVRASQTVVEALYQQTNPTFVRASQFVVEVLIPYQAMPVIPVFPQLIGLTPRIIKRPMWSTGVGTASSGREVRIGYWTLPQWEWDLTYDILNDNTAAQIYNGTTVSDLKTLVGFVLGVSGALQPFYFRDPDDNAVVGQTLGIGDGTTKTFPFVRTYGLGDFAGTEPVGGLDQTEPLNVYLDNELQSFGYTIDTITPCANFITFTTPPAAGVDVTASFSYRYFCRLKEDVQEFSRMSPNLWETQRLTITSVKP